MEMINNSVTLPVSNHSVALPSSVSNASFTSGSVISLLTEGNGRKVYRVRGTNFDVEERYNVTAIIGHGAYGVVCAVTDEVTGREIAIKRIGRVFDDLIDGRRIWRELVVLRLLNDANCRNVMKFYDLLMPKEPIHKFRDLYICTELLDTDLHLVIRKRMPFDLEFLQRLAVQMLSCIADMHALGIIHRDLKPSNILLDHELQTLAVCDFGLARGGIEHFEKPTELTDYVVTRWYRPPELLTMSAYHCPVDVWSIGCILVEYVLQRPLFVGRDYLHQLSAILQVVAVKDSSFMASRSAMQYVENVVSKMPPKLRSSRKLPTLLGSRVPAEGHEFIEWLLAFAPNDRPTPQQALEHPFLKPTATAIASAAAAAAGNKSGGGKAKLQPPEFDWSLDNLEVTEAMLRRKVWDEVMLAEERRRSHKK